jgi:hypothetical protein
VKKHLYLVVIYVILLQSLPRQNAVGQAKVATPSIQWDSTSLTRVSAPGARYSGYARMIQLHDRSLFTIYEQDGATVGVTSNDLGKTWSAPIVIAPREQGINMAVPDMLQLKDHTLLAFYNPRPFQKDTARRFAIRVKRSTDHGKTWSNEQTLYRAGHEFENGCWEPAAIQLPSGEIQLFFANEGPYTHSNEQNISLLRSRDNGHTWTKEPEIVSFRPRSRDGMPVPLLLNNGKDVVFAIEDNGIVNFKPYIITNALKENWSQTVDADDNHRQYALKEKIADSIYAGAPFIRQLKSGETILSYQGAEGRTNSMERFAEMKVVIGDKQARNFTSKSVPFTIPANKRGLWNSLCILDDDTIIALTSTNAYGNSTEVWMIKGKLRRK